MKCVPITQLTPTQKLARPITTKDGAVLCPAGLVLTQQVINRLLSTGVDLVFVESDDQPGHSPKERLDALHRRFEGVTDPILLELERVIEDYLHALA